MFGALKTRVDYEFIEGGDHSFAVPNRRPDDADVPDAVADRVSEWLHRDDVRVSGSGWDEVHGAGVARPGGDIEVLPALHVSSAVQFSVLSASPRRSSPRRNQLHSRSLLRSLSQSGVGSESPAPGRRWAFTASSFSSTPRPGVFGTGASPVIDQRLAIAVVTEVSHHGTSSEWCC